MGRHPPRRPEGHADLLQAARPGATARSVVSTGTVDGVGSHCGLPETASGHSRQRHPAASTVVAPCAARVKRATDKPGEETASGPFRRVLMMRSRPSAIVRGSMRPRTTPAQRRPLSDANRSGSQSAPALTSSPDLEHATRRRVAAGPDEPAACRCDRPRSVTHRGTLRLETQFTVFLAQNAVRRHTFVEDRHEKERILRFGGPCSRSIRSSLDHCLPRDTIGLPNRLMTVFEVAKFVGCHEETVRRAYLRGLLASQRFGVRHRWFHPADVLDWIRRGAPTKI